MTDIKLRADKEEGDKDSEIKSLKARYDDFNRTYGYRKMNPLYIYLCAAALSLVWTGIIGYYIANSIYSLSSLLKMLPHEFGGFLAGTIMPVGFIWMIAVYIDRNLNSSYEREVIYPFLQSIIDPHGDASAITNVIKKKMRAETAELKDAIEELSGHSALIENASRSVRSDVSGAVEKMRAHAAALDDIAGGLNKSSNSIDQKTGGILKSVSENIRLLLDTANAAEKKSEGITKSLVAETSRLEDTVEKTSRVVEAISETIVRNRDEIDRSTEAALARAREISAGFDGLGEKILGSVDAIEARADGIIGRIGEKTDSFIIKSNISAEKIADATGRISKAVESAGAISDDNRKMSELALEKIGREADKVAREVGRFREIAGEFGSEKAGLFGASREIAALVAELASKISAEKDGFIKSVSDVREVTEKTTGSIRSSAGEIVATTSNIKDAIGEINSLMADSSRNLGAQAGAAMKFASEIKATLKSQVEDLEAVVNSVSAQTRLGEVSIEKQGEKLAEIAEGLFAKIDAMNGRISGTINGLLGLADKIDGRFRDMNENIVARTTSASKIIADHLESAGAQSASFKEFSAAFSSEVARANSEIAALVAALKEQTFGLETATKSARDLVAGVSAEIVKARGIMPELASNMGSVGASLEKSMSQIEDAVKNAGAKRAELVENLNKVAAYFTDFASKKASEIEFVSASGTKAMTNVASYASKLASEAQGTIDAFNRQYRDMLALSEAASKKVAGIMENIGGVKDVSAPATIATEEFLNQTGYVIEKLNSLSIDLAQILTPDINQDLWNKYNAGHRGVFSKYLSSALTKKQTASIRELAKSNSGFRNYVRTFVGEFDSLMLKARATDKSEILLSTITSTDVGKVYMIIKEVLS